MAKKKSRPEEIFCLLCWTAKNCICIVPVTDTQTLKMRIENRRRIAEILSRAEKLKERLEKL